MTFAWHNEHYNTDGFVLRDNGGRMNQEHIDTIHKTLQWFYDVAYDTDELARTEEALAALEALRRQLAEAQRWTPIENTQDDFWPYMSRRFAEIAVKYYMTGRRGELALCRLADDTKGE